MTATIDDNGYLIIIPDNSLERYAMSAWIKSNIFYKPGDQDYNAKILCINVDKVND